MKILVGTDGSEFSRLALEEACEIARLRPDVSLRIVSVYAPPTPIAHEPYAMTAEYYEQRDKMARESAENNVRTAVEFVENTFPKDSIEIDTLVNLGRPSQIIVEEAEDWDADLVVVGSHGRGFWSRLALGSVSNGVVHHAPCSVLVVKSKVEKTEK